MISVRTVLSALALAFTAYLAARGLWWAGAELPQPLVAVATLSLYLATTWLCIFWEPLRASFASASDDDPDAPLIPVVPEGDVAHPAIRGARRLPLWAASLAVFMALMVPAATSFAVGPEAQTAAFATWYLGGIGALMTILMVRRRPWFAWAGIVILAVESMIFMGPASALGLGLVGSIVWVGVAQLLVRGMDRAAGDTSKLAQLQRAASAWQTSQVVRQRERRLQVQRALSVAGPVLARTVATGGSLTEDDRLEARLAEGRLRDELRGPRLLDDDVRAELERARRRGASVTVLDEGGLDGLDEASLTEIRRKLADTLRTAGSDRLFIRTSPHDSVAVTVVGRSSSDAGLSDEDAVDLWQEIPHRTV